MRAAPPTTTDPKSLGVWDVVQFPESMIGRSEGRQESMASRHDQRAAPIEGGTRRAARSAGVLSLVFALTILAACSGSSGSAKDDDASRSAEAATQSCPAASGRTVGVNLVFVNELTQDVVIRVDPKDWSCSGFDGASTPATLNGLAIGAGATVTKQLEYVYERVTETPFRMAYYTGDRVLQPITFGYYSSLLVTFNAWNGIFQTFGTVTDVDAGNCDEVWPAQMPDGSRAKLAFRSGDPDSKSGDGRRCSGTRLIEPVIRFAR